MTLARGIGLAWLVLGLAVTGCGSAPEGPNVLLVTLDTTRADRLGAYGYPKPTSPNLDALAASGVLFETAISAASNTPVSHASILTGQLPYAHGLRVLHGMSRNRLPDEAVTLAERFARAGYRTGAFVSAFPVGRRFGLAQGFEHFDAEFDAGEGEEVSAGGVVNTGRSQRRADLTTDRALAWLAGVDARFFLWVHYFDPHDVLVLPPETFVNPRDIEGIQRDKLRALYDEEIRFMDRELGRLLAAVRQHTSGELVVAVVADHGEGLGDHDWWSHGLLYQEQIRVPLLLGGRSIPAGLRVRHPVRTVDLAPTLLELAGLPSPGELDGRSLVPLFDPGAAAPDAAAYSDSFSPMVYQTPTLDPLIQFADGRDSVLLALVRDGYKYIHHVKRPERSELYHLAEDPGELHNLAAERPEVVARMRADLDSRDWRLRDDSPETPLSPEEIARLRALGYVADPTADAPPRQRP